MEGAQEILSLKMLMKLFDGVVVVDNFDMYQIAKSSQATKGQAVIIPDEFFQSFGLVRTSVSFEQRSIHADHHKKRSLDEDFEQLSRREVQSDKIAPPVFRNMVQKLGCSASH